MRALVIALAAGLVAAPAASADWGPPALLTVSPLEQADGVGTSALSADGHYLVFSGSLDGVAGILRRDLATGLTEPVAAADAYGGDPVTGASDPSVSADGRYVSFTTTAALDPADDHNAASDVYVRDMDAAAPVDGAACAADGGPCAYTLASALDGVATGISYTGEGGSAAAPRQALSADGRHVAFVVRAPSDLAGADTPGGQVALRDLDRRATTLVSVARDPDSGAMTGAPVPGGAITAGRPVLSADGTTVAWDGARIGRQAATVPGDPALTDDPYNEPLWRRVADGPGAPTRRVAGAADPGAPGCPPDGTFADPACQGPYPDLAANREDTFGVQGGWLAAPDDTRATPSLSADGRAVAFIGGPPAHLGARSVFTRISDLFVADLHDGVPRRQGVRRLTQYLLKTESEQNETPRYSVADAAISPDGRRIALAVARPVFTLTPPFLIGTPPPLGANELWLVDLDADTLARLSTTVDGGASAGTIGSGATSPSFDATGRALAFDSTASNLVAVDANEANDAFLVQDRSVPPGVPGRVDLAPPPAPVAIPRAWRLALRAVAQRDGSVRLDADLPGAGVLRATVEATVPVWRTTKVKQKGGGHRTVRKHVLARRQVAKGSATVRRDGLTRLSVRVTKAYKTLARTKAGLDATAKVTFTAPRRATLRDTLAVRFRVTPVKKQTTKKPKTTKKAKR